MRFLYFIFVVEGKRSWAVGREQFGIGEVIKGAVLMRKQTKAETSKECIKMFI